MTDPVTTIRVEIARVRGEHRIPSCTCRVDDDYETACPSCDSDAVNGRCTDCHRPWPCDIIRLADALEVLLDSLVDYDPDHPFSVWPHWVDEGLTEAAAKLEDSDVSTNS